MWKHGNRRKLPCSLRSACTVLTSLRTSTTTFSSIFGLRFSMNPSPPLCSTTTLKFVMTGKWVFFSTPSCLLRLLDPATERLIGTSSVTTARSLGEVIRPHANRLLPIVLQQVANDRLYTTRSRRLALLFRSYEDNDRRFNELPAPKASRPLAVAAPVNRRHVRRQCSAVRLSTVTIPPTRRR